MSSEMRIDTNSDGTRSRFQKAQIRVVVCLMVLSAYILAIVGWLALMTPIDVSVCLVVGAVLGWLTLRLHPGWVVIFLLAITWCIQGTPGRYQAWFESIQLAAWGGLLVAWRTNFNAISSALEQQITVYISAHSVLHRAGTKAQSRGRVLSLFFLKGLLEVMVVITFAIGLAVFASVLLGRNPLGGGYDDWVDWTIKSGQALWPNPLFVVIVLGALLLIREHDKRGITVAQARVWVKSESMRWQFQDLLRIVKSERRIQSRRKRRDTSSKEAET